ncbi:MAG TPA: S46 family peptidase, partial [Bacteroidia bacterium]
VKALKDDIGMQYFQSVLSLYFKVLQASGNSMQKEDELMKEYMAAVMEYRKKDLLYPDANFTLRLTYGEVLSYNGTDGKNMGYLTNASEILDKESTTNEEFEVFPRLKELIQKKDYGRYAEQGQDLKVNFLTTHDITGGNSGSPVMNKEGALIGIAFDGNWESMVGDLSYQANTQRTISVDIRYVLFIIDKYAGATNIIEELTLVD